MVSLVFDRNVFVNLLDQALEEFAVEFSLLCRKVIEEERIWDGWETSNPLRDIVDTNALNESMLTDKEQQLSYYVQWATEYVQYVYFGYSLPDGRRIPPRKWAEIAVSENDILSLFADILRKYFAN